MGRIIRLHGDGHRDLQTLLPWYVTGQLDPLDQARVEAHLAGCQDCRAEVRFQRRLNVEIADLPIDADQGWRRMQGRIESESRPRSHLAAGGWLRRIGDAVERPRSAWLGWAMAGGLAAVMSVAMLPSTRPGNYHALGAAAPAVAGNAVVMFRPDTAEKDMREMMAAGGARLVDGPTRAGAYILHVPPGRRDAVLTAWRGRADVVLAEPIDSSTAPR